MKPMIKKGNRKDTETVRYSPMNMITRMAMTNYVKHFDTYRLNSVFTEDYTRQKAKLTNKLIFFNHNIIPMDTTFVPKLFQELDIPLSIVTNTVIIDIFQPIADRFHMRLLPTKQGAKDMVIENLREGRTVVIFIPDGKLFEKKRDSFKEIIDTVDNKVLVAQYIIDNFNGEDNKKTNLKSLTRYYLLGRKKLVYIHFKITDELSSIEEVEQHKDMLYAE